MTAARIDDSDMIIELWQALSVELDEAQIHPSGDARAREFLAEMRDTRSLAEASRLADRIRKRIAMEQAWHQKKIDFITAKYAR